MIPLIENVKLTPLLKSLPLRGFARDAGFAEEKYVFFSAERAEKKRIYILGIGETHSRVNKINYSKKIVMSQGLCFLFSFLSKENKKRGNSAFSAPLR